MVYVRRKRLTASFLSGAFREEILGEIELSSIFATGNIGRSSVRGEACIGIRLRLQNVIDGSRTAILHFGGRPNSFLLL
jgi:hypothetical protein